jgi:AcrR family transcriptional regulator
MQEAPLSPVRAARREKLLDAAQAVFLQAGLQAATMEAIAAQGGVSKVTLYGYFSDKDAAFHGVAVRLAGQLRASTLDSLAQPGTATQKVTRALQTKHGMVHALLRNSPLSDELLVSRLQVRDLWLTLDADLTASIARVTGDADTARLLFDASLGIADNARDTNQMQADIARLTKAILGGTG